MHSSYFGTVIYLLLGLYGGLLTTSANAQRLPAAFQASKRGTLLDFGVLL
jgi:hypothetical protein